MKIDKNLTNPQVVYLLRSISSAYQLKDAAKNKFRIIAYEKAADAIEHLSSEVKDIWDEGKLEEIPGVGESIAKYLDEIFKTGSCKHFEEILRGFPSVLFDLIPLPKIGPKTAHKLVTELGIKSVADLEKAARKGKIAQIPGFGVESQKEILEAIEQSKSKEKRMLLPYAIEIADQIILWMKKLKDVEKVDPLGSVRRKSSTVGDIDISIASNNPEKVLNHFVQYPKVKKVIEKGNRTSSVLLPNDVQVDIMVQKPESYGSLLQHFTGSKHHNIALREYALKKGMSLSEYGIKKEGKIKKFSDEKDFYNYLGMQWIPPELREDMGEIEKAREKEIPQLIKLSDVKGDLQMHSDFDIETSHDLGASSMEEMINKGNDLGYEYIAFTEHNPSRSQHKENEINELIERKKEIIDKLNYSYVKNMKGSIKKVFNSLEIDILPDGQIALPEKTLDLLDFALVSIHSSFNKSRKEMTERVLKALEHPKVKIFAHPTARKLNEREGIELDWPKIFDFCKEKNKWIEINADPMRLDLPDMMVKEAVRYGVLLTLGTDAHHEDSMNNMIYGVFVARRGWAESRHLVNTRSLNVFEKMLK